MTQDHSKSTAGAVPLPRTADEMAADHPDLWAAFQNLGEQASLAGPRARADWCTWRLQLHLNPKGRRTHTRGARCRRGLLPRRLSTWRCWRLRRSAGRAR